MPTSENFSVNKKSGFTLIELLVVVSIIAILSLIGLTVYSSVQARARDAKRKADVEAIAKAYEANYAVGSYPKPKDEWFGSGGIPKDPQGSHYRWNDTANPPTAATSSGYVVCADLDTATGNSSDDGTVDGTTFTFTYVAENNGGFFCRKNLQ